MPWWYNPELSNDSLVTINWYEKGIIQIGDILDSSNDIRSITYIVQTYNVQPMDFLTYHRLKTSIVRYLQINGQQKMYVKPNIPYILIPLIKSKKGIKPIYRKLLNTAYIFSSPKWENELLVTIDKGTWTQVFSTCFYTLKDSYLTWMQIKIIYRILGTKEYLHKLKITD